MLDLAKEKGCTLGFEAAVAGGLPVIKTLREGLAANQITGVYGILNGTSNYILSRMHQTREDFAVILKQAQRLGYAEADPTLDINGIDTAHKLALLTAIAFECPIRYHPENVIGIERITPDDILFSEDLGYRIRLLGVAKVSEVGLEQRVHPCLLPSDSPLSNIQDVLNAVIFQGPVIDQLTVVGRGAGGGPTASAVLADLIDIACEHNRLRPLSTSTPRPIIPLKDRIGAYYVRLMVRDEVGVLASIASVFSRMNVSIEQFIQRKNAPGEYVPVVLTTHSTKEDNILQGIGDHSDPAPSKRSLSDSNRTTLEKIYGRLDGCPGSPLEKTYGRRLSLEKKLSLRSGPDHRTDCACGLVVDWSRQRNGSR